MNDEATILLIEQSLKLHRKGKLDAGDFLASARQLLGVETKHLIGQPFPPKPYNGASGSASAALTQEPEPDRSVLREPAGNRVSPDAPLDVDHPDEAMLAVMGAPLRDYLAGELTGSKDEADAKEKIVGQVQRRATEVRAMRRDLLQRPAARNCADCDALATMIVTGTPYCDAHGEQHKPPMPSKIVPIKDKPAEEAA